MVTPRCLAKGSDDEVNGGDVVRLAATGCNTSVGWVWMLLLGGVVVMIVE